MLRALITGASGFAGPYLAQHLLGLGYEVVGGIHGPEARLPIRCRQVCLDVTDQEGIQRVVAEVQPDEIYHLAGLTRPVHDQIYELYRVNFGGALNMLEVVREHAPETAVLLVGSAYAYGRSERPIAETRPLEPVNHYGISKAAADMLGRRYALEGLRVVNVRPFNHSGPGQGPAFLLPALVQQFVEIKLGKREPVVRLGNLDSVRDFSDVRDIVRGYYLALQKGRAGEAYNLGSGQKVSVLELYELVQQEAGVEAELRVEPSRVRAMDIPYLVADVSKAYRALEWKPEIPLRQTTRDMLDAFQDRLKRGDKAEKL
jgi:GDP-4-dehydro-6-deoxy-D-mannose reductase